MANYQTAGNGKKPNDVVFTGKYIFEALQLTFDLDPAHPPYKTNVPTNHYYTEENDGLKMPWFGLIWCNPPYSKPKPWIDKFIKHGNGIMLIPIAKSLSVQKLWEEAHAICYLPPNNKFETPDGKQMQIMFPVALFAMGNCAVKALNKSGLGRVR